MEITIELKSMDAAEPKTENTIELKPGNIIDLPQEIIDILDITPGKDFLTYDIVDGRVFLGKKSPEEIEIK